MNYRLLTIGVLAAVATGCAVGPDYRRPDIDAAANYKEVDGWKPSAPNDTLDRGNWWQIFEDPVLDGLERQIDISNQNVRSAAAAVEQAQALLHESQAAFWPTIGASADRQRTATNPGGGSPVFRTSNSARLDASWDIDIWGEIRRSTQSSRASFQASEATLAAARLSAQAQLASAYFELRSQDQLQALLNDTVAGQEQSLKITQSRYKFGVAAKADVVAAQAQLLSSQAQQANAPIQRAILEHAIAVLVGQQPAGFSIERAPMRGTVPTVAAGLPTALLERRPDIAEAERRVAAASAQIGVARAAFFPSATLSASDVYSGDTIRRLISASNRVWAFGPTLALSVFDGGLRRAQVAAARANFDASVDNYRQTVLSAFQQVEDEIVTLRALEKQSAIEQEAVKAAGEAERLTLNQYKAGTVPYSSVISAQTTRLNSEINALTVLTNRLGASVTLIEALGGGWSTAQLH